MWIKYNILTYFACILLHCVLLEWDFTVEITTLGELQKTIVGSLWGIPRNEFNIKRLCLGELVQRITEPQSQIMFFTNMITKPFCLFKHRGFGIFFFNHLILPPKWTNHITHNWHICWGKMSYSNWKASFPSYSLYCMLPQQIICTFDSELRQRTLNQDSSGNVIVTGQRGSSISKRRSQGRNGEIGSVQFRSQSEDKSNAGMGNTRKQGTI